MQTYNAFLCFGVVMLGVVACHPRPSQGTHVSQVTKTASVCEKWTAQFESDFADAIKGRPHADASASDVEFYEFMSNSASYCPTFVEELEDCCFFARSLKPSDIPIGDGSFTQCIEKDSGVELRRGGTMAMAMAMAMNDLFWKKCPT